MLFFIAQTAVPFETLATAIGIVVIASGTIGALWDQRNRVKSNKESIARLERVHEACIGAQTRRWEELAAMMIEIERKLERHGTKLDLILKTNGGSPKDDK